LKEIDSLIVGISVALAGIILKGRLASKAWAWADLRLLLGAAVAAGWLARRSVYNISPSLNGSSGDCKYYA
jgi:hypothetical protein